MYTKNNKVVNVDELVSHVRNGDCVAIGGGLSAREPMAIIRAMIRKGIADLELVGSAHGIDVDILCGAGVVAVCAESYVGFEQDFGMAPNYRRACESGAVSIKDNCCYTLVQQLRAAISGVSFMPINSTLGTDFMSLHPEYKIIACPFTGSDIAVVPALQPDIAILHAQLGDDQGNLVIEGPPVADVLFAKAAKKVIATVEKLIPTEQLVDKNVTVPYFYVTALSEVPYGAHPTSCYPLYAYDRAHTKTYYNAAQDGPEAFREKYLDKFVFSCQSHEEYINRVKDTGSFESLTSWNDSREKWMALYA